MCSNSQINFRIPIPTLILFTKGEGKVGRFQFESLVSGKVGRFQFESLVSGAEEEQLETSSANHIEKGIYLREATKKRLFF